MASCRVLGEGGARTGSSTELAPEQSFAQQGAVSDDPDPVSLPLFVRPSPVSLTLPYASPTR